MRIVTVVGTRPQLVKAAALQPILRRHHSEVFVDTGQHWDDDLAGAFYRELGLASPDVVLNAGGGTHAEQVAAVLLGLDPVLTGERRPDAVIVLGDTNSTLAGALAAVKLGIPVAHVEAGLRSGDLTMPEEINQIVVDHVARWLFAPTATAMTNLAMEGIRGHVVLTGDLMQDLAAQVLEQVRDPAALASIGQSLGMPLAPGGYLLATIHRAENRRPAAIRAWTSLLDRVARSDRPVVLPLHPGTAAAIKDAAASVGPYVHIVPPIGYATSLALQLHAAAVLTDSGGIQREAAWLGTPCLVVRSTTEWVETLIEHGASHLVGHDAGVALSLLDTLAPVARSNELARARAATASIQRAGAAEAIVGALMH